MSPFHVDRAERSRVSTIVKIPPSPWRVDGSKVMVHRSAIDLTSSLTQDIPANKIHLTEINKSCQLGMGVVPTRFTHPMSLPFAGTTLARLWWVPTQEILDHIPPIHITPPARPRPGTHWGSSRPPPSTATPPMRHQLVPTQEVSGLCPITPSHPDSKTPTCYLKRSSLDSILLTLATPPTWPQLVLTCR